MFVVQSDAQAKRQARVASKFKKKGLHSLTTDDVTVILEQVYVLGRGVGSCCSARQVTMLWDCDRLNSSYAIACVFQVGFESMASSVRNAQVEGSKIASCSDGDDFTGLLPSSLAPQQTTSCFGALMNYFTSAFSARQPGGVRTSDSFPA